MKEKITKNVKKMNRDYKLQEKDLQLIRVNDVFDFSYDKATKEKMRDPYWCFDGQLIAKKDPNGKIYLEDTYWTASGNTTFALEEVLKKGTLTYICNLNEVKTISEYDTCYYADKDIYNLSYQSGYHKRFAINKDAKRDKEKMLEVINERISGARSKIDYEITKLEDLAIKKSKVESGKLNIYI